MAAPAAALRILIDANARPARREIAKADRSLKQFSGQAAKMSDVRLDADGKPLQRQLARSKKELGSYSRAGVSSTGRLNAGFGVLARGAGLAGAAIGAVGLAGSIKVMVDEARESARVGRQTDAVLRSTGRAAKVSRVEIEGLADSLSAKIGVDDEAIQSSENLLLTFTRVRNEVGQGNNIFSRAIPVIADMSAMLGTSLNRSTIMVGKALQDPIKGITALRRVGVNFNGEQSKMIKGWVESGQTLRAQKYILKELGTEFGGQAAAVADPLSKLKVAVLNTAEALGLKLLPALNSVLTPVAEFITQLRTGGGAGGQFGAQVTKSFQAIGRVVGPVFADLGKTIRSIRTSGDLAAWSQALHNVFVGIATVVNRFVLPVLQRLAPAVRQSLGGMIAVARGLLNILAGIFTLNFGRIWEGVRQTFGGLGQMIVGNLRAMTAPARQAAVLVGQAIVVGVRAAVGMLPGWLRNLISGAVHGMGVAARAAGAAVVAAFRWLATAAANTFGWISTAARKVAAVLAPIFRPVIGMWRGTFQMAVAAVRAVVTAGVRALGPVVRVGMAVVTAIFRVAWGVARAIAKTAADVVVGHARRLASVSAAVFRAFLATTRTVWGAIKAAIIQPVGSAAGWVISRLNSFKKTLAGIWGAIKEGAARGWGAIGDAIVNPVKNAVEGVKNFLNKIIGYLNSVLGFFHLDKIGKIGGGEGGSSKTGKAIAGAGKAPSFAVGGKVTKPMAIVGEEAPRHPEYVIATNPRYRQRNQQLAAQAAGAVGLPGYAEGGIVQLGRQLQKQGFTVGEHPAFGGVAPVHTQGSYHYRGMALDVNADGAVGGEMRALDRLYSQLKGKPGIVELLWRVKGHFDHLHVAMGKGGGGGLLGFLKGIPGKIADFAGQGGAAAVKGITSALMPATKALPDWVEPIGRSALKMIGGGAAKMLEGAAAEGPEAAFGGGPMPKGNAKAWLTKALQITGHFSPGNLAALYRQMMSESGGNPRAINLWDSNAKAGHPSKGLLQTIDSTFASYKMAGMNDIWNPVHNAVAAIRYMIATYGHIVGTGRGYAQGGILGFARGGILGLQKGGALAPKQKPKGKPKRRGKPFDALQLFGMWGRAQSTEVPSSIRNAVEQFSSQAGFAGEMADRAQTLGMPVQGLDEMGWLQRQLGALGALRNQLVQAYQAAMQRRAMLSKMLEQLQAQLKKLQEERKRLLERVKEQQAALAAAKKGRKVGKKKIVNKAAVAVAQGTLDRSNARLTDVKEVLAGMPTAISGVRKRRDALAESGAKSLESLAEVQGAYGPITLMPRLPEVGALGGTIFSVQARIAELSKPAETAADVSTGVSGTDDNAAELAAQQAELLRQLLREANVRTAVSERQFATLRQLPPYGGSFATGGVVPGPTGAPRAVVAHGGETITPAGQGAITVVVNGDITNVPAGRDPVEVVLNDRRFAVAVERATRPAGRSADRRLPSSRASF